MTAIHYGSICSGIGAASQAWIPLGFKCDFMSEIESKACQVLKKHFTAPNEGDFTKIGLDKYLNTHLLVGGTPCQAFSVAGNRESLSDNRGNLTLAFAKMVKYLAEKGNLYGFVWENVPGVLSTKDNAFGCFLGETCGASSPLQSPTGQKWPNSGMVSGPKARIVWRILDSQYFGVPQQRRRVFGVASFDTAHFCPEKILFEPKVLPRDIEEMEKKEVPSPTLSVKRDDKPIIILANGQTNAAITCDKTSCLTCNHETQIVYKNHELRRLTPEECEILQGFPINYTDCVANTHRYRLIGNSMTVNVMRWIGENIVKEIRL